RTTSALPHPSLARSIRSPSDLDSVSRPISVAGNLTRYPFALNSCSIHLSYGATAVKLINLRLIRQCPPEPLCGNGGHRPPRSTILLCDSSQTSMCVTG